MAGLWPLSLAVLGALAFIPATDAFTKPALLTILVFGLAWITLDTIYSRAIVDAQTVALISPRPSRRLRVPISEVVRYGIDKGGEWRIETEGRTTRIPFQHPWELHAAMVEFAPTKLGAKRLRPLHLPPTEEFANLWTLDTDGLVAEALWRGIVCVGVGFAFRAGAAATGPLGALLLFTLGKAWSRLDVMNESLVLRSPFRRIRIDWAEATAIFCENPRTRRSFVVTAPGRGIEIPAHLAREVELMRKVFRSLPEGTLAVNFDETTFRGYRRRKQAKEKTPARNEDLLPVLTACGARASACMRTPDLSPVGVE